MSILEALILGVVQGVAEFLPISSSGHLVLAEEILGLKAKELISFDILVHFGTLLAIFVYFRKDFKDLIVNFFAFLIGKRKKDDPSVRLSFYIILASIPAAVAGLTLKDFIEEHMRSGKTVAIAMIVTGIVFAIGEIVSKFQRKELGFKDKVTDKIDEVRDFVQAKGFESREIRRLNLFKALLIGFAQVFALIPGVSRSGSTIVAGIFQGIERKEAARFSFLLGAPIIFGATLVAFKDVLEGSAALTEEISFTATMVGFFAAFIAGLASVSFLMSFLKRFSLKIFAIYLVALGMFVLAFGV